MQLPKNILSTTMKKHQKYFSLLTKSGNLAPFFIVVANTPKNKFLDKTIIEGNERVLKARLTSMLGWFDMVMLLHIESIQKNIYLMKLMLKMKN